MQRGEEGEFRIDELYIAAAKELIESVASSITLIHSSGVYQISFDSIKLEALANALNVFGWTDPIGEIKNWFYDRLKEIATFFSSTVDAITKPIKDVVNSVWSFVQGIPNAVVSGVKVFIDTLSSSVSSLASSVSSYFTHVLSKLSDIASSISASISSAVSSILQGVLSALSSVSSTISSVFLRLWDSIQVIGSSISDAFGRLSSILSSIPSAIIQGVQSLFAQLSSSLQGIGQSILGALQSFASSIQGAIQGVVSSLSYFASQIWNGIQSIGISLAGVADRIWSGLQSVGQSVLGALQSFAGMVQSAISSVAGTLSGLISRVWEGLQSIGSAVSGFFSRVWEGIQSFGKMVSDFFGRIWDGIQSGLKWVWDQLQVFGKWLWDSIQGGLKWLWDALTSIGSKIWEGLQWFGKSVSDMFIRVWDGLQAVGKLVLSGVEGLGTAIQNALSAIQRFIEYEFSIVGGALSSFGRLVVDGFTRIGQSLSDFAKIFDKWATTLYGGVQAIGSGFTQFLQYISNLPNVLQSIFGGIADFFKRVGEVIAEFVRSPLEFIKKHIIEPIWGGIQWLAGKMWDGLQWMWQKIVEGAQWLWGALQQAGQWMLNAIAGIASAIQNAFTGIANTISGVGKTAYEFIINMFMKIKELVSESMQKYVKGVISEFMSAVGWGSPPGLTSDNFVKAWGTSLFWSLPLYAFALAVEIPIRGAAYGLQQLGNKLSGMDWKIRLSLKFLGAGGDIEFNLAKALGDSLQNFGKEMMKHAEKFYEPFWMGIGFWFGRYASTLLIYNLRNFIPIEMPSFREAEELWNRIRSTALTSFKIPEDVVGKPEDAEDVIINFLKMRGYSDYVLKLAFADENEFYLEIEDRFGVKRKIPLADAWRVPPPSDIITMMIRDVIIDPKYFAAVMRMQGFNKDTSILYYYLHFRYPPPERLAEFYWRGMARVLWFDRTLEEEGLKTFLGLEAIKATPPRKINENPNILNNMIMMYMKWHDYAPFAWQPGFPTDKSIMVELMADLPDKVDFRWLTRYGIIEHMSSLGVKMDTTIDGIVSAIQGAKGDELTKKQVTPEISLDVSLLSRFLIARGMHPYLASIVSVAESHVMLADEMTLLRSGFLYLYRWGMANVDQLEQLMSGLFVIKFTTGYIDTDGTPHTYTYNKPVFWLPAERRLLQLRAAMDRYYELFRDFVREVERGVRSLALHTKSTAEEVKKYVSQLNLDKETSEAVNKALSSISQGFAEDLIKRYGGVVTGRLSDDIAKISGVKVSFTVDDVYIDSWIKSAELTRTIESRTWIRHYATRLVAWILYRTSYGWTPVEKFSNLTAILLARGWITIEEKEFLDTIASWVYGIVRREMIPTPLQLATFSEYMKVSDDLIEKVLEEHRVPDDYRQLYKQYISYRFIKTDFKTYINRARRAYVLGIISDADWGSILKEAVEKYGFRNEEVSIMQRIADLEEQMESVRVWRPSLTTIATISEVVPIPDDVMNKIFAKFRIDPLIAPYVTEYVKRRPLVDELRSLVNEYYRMKYYSAVYKQTIPQDIEQAVQKYMQLFGLTEEERAIRDLVAKIRETVEMWRESAREYIPTPSMLATIAEYVPSLTDEMINKVLEARRVPQEWRAIWMQYIKARTLADEVRTLINAFYRMKRYAMLYGYAVPKDVENTVIKYAKMIGVTDEEKSIRDLIAEIEATVDNWRDLARRGESIPTLSQLVVMAEYINVPVDYVKKVLEARRVEHTYANLWLQYLYARSISTEVNRVVRAFEDLYIRFAVPEDVVKQVTSLMAQGGWTEQELKIFGFELDLRRAYRVLTMMMPSIRQFITDAQYLSNYEKLFQDLLQTYAIDAEKYKKQVDYYKRLLKNRRLWRHFSWYRTQLTYALMYGSMTEDEIKKKLQQFVNLGLIDEDELNVIIDGIKIRAAAYAAYRALRYR